MDATIDAERLTPLARSRIYSHLAACFRYPDAAAWELLSAPEEREKFAQAVAILAEEEGYGAIGSHADGLRVEECGSLDGLKRRFEEVFGHTISKQCPPYETEYGGMHLFQQSDFLADLGGFYRAFGVEPRERADRLDHISIQLEFLHFLAFKEAHALQHHGEEKVQICREAQADFMEAHLGRWVSVFAERLERHDSGGLYGEAARLLSAFTEAEIRALSAEPASVPDVSRGELLPMASDDWDSSDWQPAGSPAPDAN